MMRSAHWRGMALPILCLTLAACGSDARKNSADPNAPAVVKVAPPVLPSDTAKKPPPPPIVDPGDARMIITRNYALAGAGLSNQDPKLLRAAYSPAAQLTTPNGTFTGTIAILKEYQSFGMDGSVKEFTRQSRVLSVVDSTVADSGTYTVQRNNSRGETSTETGAYATVWKIQAPPLEWVMTKDHLYSPKKKAK